MSCLTLQMREAMARVQEQRDREVVAHDGCRAVAALAGGRAVDAALDAAN